MSSDVLAVDAAGLSPRATIALLTLQLRAAIREMEQAELAESQWDADAASTQLRDRLVPLVEQRRATMAVELDRARAHAAARVDAVRAECSTATSRERHARPGTIALRDPSWAAPVVVAPVMVAPVVVEPVVVEPVVVEPEMVEPAVVEPVVVEPEMVAPVVVEPEMVEPAVVEPVVVESEMVAPVVVQPFAPPRVLGPPSRSEDELQAYEPVLIAHARSADNVSSTWSRPSTAPSVPLTAVDVRAIVSELLAERYAGQTAAPTPIAVDSDVLSRALASALGAAFEERLLVLPVGQPAAWPRYATSPPPRKSFWANMWHADVMMSLLAAVIIVVVLIAWSA